MSMNEADIVRCGQEEMMQLAADIQTQTELKIQAKAEELENEQILQMTKLTSKTESEQEKIRKNGDTEIGRMVKKVSKEVDRKLDVIRKNKERLSKIEKSKLAREEKAQFRQKQKEIAQKVRQQQKDVLAVIERALKNGADEPSDEDYVSPATRDLLIPQIDISDSDDADETGPFGN